jgi:hypothetical protein
MYNNKVAVLCNGPSRSAYNPNTEYAYRIGCNIPWTKVDCTVVLDEEIVRKWAKQQDLIDVPTYFSVNAWRETYSTRIRDTFFRKYMVEVIKPHYPYHSSGHNAAEIVIKLGYKELDIYGCDSWFSQNVDSYTRQFIKSTTQNTPDMHTAGWRKRWKDIIAANPDVKINFIEGVSNV